jgi:hypothetical protein
VGNRLAARVDQRQRSRDGPKGTPCKVKLHFSAHPLDARRRRPLPCLLGNAQL